LTTQQHSTKQFPLPVRKALKEATRYDIYPSFNIDDDQIFEGYDTLSEIIINHKTVIIDGYNGVYYDYLQGMTDAELRKSGARVCWLSTSQFLKPEKEIEELTSPFTGGDDPLFGTRADLSLQDIFKLPALQATAPDPDYDINVIYGPGACLAGWEGLLVYIDLPKNELQYRARSGKISNLGFSRPAGSKAMYKRSYFVDWPLLNRHKQAIIGKIDIFIDGQRPDIPVWMEGNVLRSGLSEMSRNIFRTRPWFESGPWGGTWIKDNMEGINKEVPNYAWSFELITPENGLLFESSSKLLEVSFDSLMFLEAEAVLGDCHDRFGSEFPMRFDFLDTINGGNLSIQCHPKPEYIKTHFGENFTQEETYYILDSKDDAVVYLGFRNDIDPVEFRDVLERSAERKEIFKADKYILSHPSSKHDFFLIPYGTVHGSGKDNLVLEISTTPYIFTFKMYDWLRMDLDGRPRDLNISRAMDNLIFKYKGDYVMKHLKSRPILLEEGSDWQLWHLPTHKTHLYDVQRYNFRSSINIHTGNKCLVMSLVEGCSIMVETQHGAKKRINFAETFIIPAAAKSVRITNLSDVDAMLIKAFIK
jgi:mannose-6-phosphate isomerase class I